MTTEANKATETIAAPAAISLLGRMTPAERSRGRYLRSPDGHPDPAPAPEPAPEPAPAPAPEPAPIAGAAPIRPEGLDDKFWDAATGLKVGDLVSELRDLQAKAAERTADLPAEGEGYDLALPADLQLPEGAEVVIDKDDPLWADFQKIARDAGVPKGKFTEFIGAFAKYQAAAQAADVETYTAEMGKLGANATERRDAATNWLKANLPTPQFEALTKLKSGPVAATGVGGNAGATSFEGLHGASRLEAIRAQQAAAA